MNARALNDFSDFDDSIDVSLDVGVPATQEDDAARFGEDLAEPAPLDLNPGPLEAEIGGNNPPVLTPFQAVKARVDDLYLEATNWLDGIPPNTQEQVDAVSVLIDQMRKAEKDTDEARKVEKRPLDAQVKDVQDRYNPVLARAVKAVAMFKQAIQPFLVAEQKRLDDIAEAARVEAKRLSDAAADAARSANALDIQAQDAAEALVKDAKSATTYANQAGRQTAGGATGGARKVSLRDSWAPVMSDNGVALQHYLTTNLEAVDAFLLELARKDVAAGKRTIPGFNVVNTPVAV